MDLYRCFVETLKKELIPALGCTEPIAIAYTAASARDLLGVMPEKALLKVSGNVLKNVKSVAVPNTCGMKGVDSACVAGILGGDAELGLEVLRNVNPEHVTEARRLLAEGFCAVEQLISEKPLHISVTVFAGEHSAYVELADGHTRIIKKEKDGETVFALDSAAEEENTEECSLSDIFNFAQTVNTEDVRDVIRRQIEYNTAICAEGLSNRYGQNIGKTLLAAYGSGDVKIRARALAAAGSDARMSGCCLPVIINSGSGNQGITVSVPVIEFAKETEADEDTLYRALVLSNLVAIHLKKGMGKLSAFCGVVSAACGAGAGITYLYTRDYDKIAQTVTNTLADVSGIVCDGAKGSCAAKIASSVDACILAHYLTMSGNTFRSGDGIVRKDVDATMQGIMRIGKESMKETDREILNIMFEQYGSAV